jgi:hypothetical protein
MEDEKLARTTPGKHPQFTLQRFGGEEQRIIEKLSNEWFLTNSGARLALATSEYDYFLMKPTHLFSEMFNIERELIVVFSAYPEFEPRTLDAFETAQQRLSGLRVEATCRVLISKDPNIELKIEKLLKSDPEQPVVIPFSYAELLSNYDTFFIRNKFRSHFYTRDLFSFLSPLKKDLYFFGRSELLQEIVNRHRSGEHTGLFGLRKTGKTSIIFAIERYLLVHGERFISIDCESPSIHKLRWNELLERLVCEYHKKKESKYKIPTGLRYDEKHAADSFTEDVLNIYRSKKAMPVLVFFDEIERISPGIGSSSHWKDGDDFVYFWQTLRGFYQRNHNVFTYMIAGTNPSCVEAPMIHGHENPIFASIPAEYIPPFTVSQTREMVRKLGRYMGLKFDEMIYSKLTEDFGGHPFLIRQMCSSIHRFCIGERPAIIDKALYERVKKEFVKISVEYFEMILQVLQEWYPDEYDMLRFLAQGDIESFDKFARDYGLYTKHLTGYGLIQHSEHGYSFTTEAIKDYLTRKHEYERINLTLEEKRTEISVRRNRIEKGLRALIRSSLKVAFGKIKIAEKVIASLSVDRREALVLGGTDNLLDPEKSPLYFNELVQLIFREWDIFKNVFDMDKEHASVILQDINKFRSDAHTKGISEEDFNQLRLHFCKIESILKEFE